MVGNANCYFYDMTKYMVDCIAAVWYTICVSLGDKDGCLNTGVIKHT